jgi:hypothetical protein
MTTKFTLDGTHEHQDRPDGQGRIGGEIEFVDGTNFYGKFGAKVLKDLKLPVEGALKRNDGVYSLDIFRLPIATNCTFAFFLNKTAGRSPEGEYNGVWGPLSFDVKYDEENGLYVARINKNGIKRKDQRDITLTLSRA